MFNMHAGVRGKSIPPGKSIQYGLAGGYGVVYFGAYTGTVSEALDQTLNSDLENGQIIVRYWSTPLPCIHIFVTTKLLRNSKQNYVMESDYVIVHDYVYKVVKFNVSFNEQHV